MKYIVVATNGKVLANPVVLGWSNDRSKAHKYSSRKEAERDGREAGRGYPSSPYDCGVNTVPTFSHVEEVQ